MKRILFSHLAVVLPLLAIGMCRSVLADSQQLEIQDCSGAVRASSKLETGLQSRVVVAFEHEQSVLVSLLNLATQKTVAVKVEGKTAAFDGVNGGAWKACPLDAADQEIAWISISQNSASSTFSTPVVVGGSMVGAGIAALGLSSSNSSAGSEQSSILLSGEPGSNLQSQAAAASRQTEAATTCINNRSPAPISSFF